MSGYVMAAAGYWASIAVLEGPRLLSGVAQGPGLDEHRVTWQAPPMVGAAGLVADLRKIRLLGRGGAHFPFARKLATALESGRKREVVVNAAESEPASAKDSALMTTTREPLKEAPDAPTARALGWPQMESLAAWSALAPAAARRGRGRRKDDLE